ncbi:hypothetical protein HaLaN_03279 [Haematococcus lacustris]|uniref:Uncharacterized protein n=1 Tax=Haematococcus lacustris TaxID=44745 RepID=A0A699YNG1_HAELA|nr:hypothetical protein HaLaN_03279 [Haematococcus lacustris]
MDDTPPAPAAQGWRAEAAAAQSCGPARDTLPVCVRDSQGPPAGQELTSTGSATSPRPAVDLPHTLPVADAGSAHSLACQLGKQPGAWQRELRRKGGLLPGTLMPQQPEWVQRISDQDLYCSLDGAGAGPTGVPSCCVFPSSALLTHHRCSPRSCLLSMQRGAPPTVKLFELLQSSSEEGPRGVDQGDWNRGKAGGGQGKGRA